MSRAKHPGLVLVGPVEVVHRFSVSYAKPPQRKMGQILILGWLPRPEGASFQKDRASWSQRETPCFALDSLQDTKNGTNQSRPLSEPSTLPDIVEETHQHTGFGSSIATDFPPQLAPFEEGSPYRQRFVLAVRNAVVVYPYLPLWIVGRCKPSWILGLPNCQACSASGQIICQPRIIFIRSCDNGTC